MPTAHNETRVGCRLALARAMLPRWALEKPVPCTATTLLSATTACLGAISLDSPPHRKPNSEPVLLKTPLAARPPIWRKYPHPPSPSRPGTLQGVAPAPSLTAS